MSRVDEFVSEDWNSFLLVRWTVFGEWMTSRLDGTVDSGSEGSTLLCQSCFAGWRHCLHFTMGALGKICPKILEICYLIEFESF